MTQQTPLYHEHVKLGAKIVDFGGWDMPLHYGSQLNEHHFVRQDAGIFDVSHMTVIDIIGSQAFDYLRHLLANDVAKLDQPGKALYSCMLNPKGGVIDDLIVYFLAPDAYRLVVNASTRDKDLAWMTEQARSFSISLVERRDLAMIAAQGPQARAKLGVVLGGDCAEKLQNLRIFHTLNDKDLFIARTGYTGEDGVEILLPASQAAHFWQTLIQAGFAPCGLGARDTLRLEAGLNLYGSDMDETTTPFESNLSWTVSMNDDRNFIGREALEIQKKTGVPRALVGLISHERGAILRSHQKIYLEGEGVGEITSGTFSPTLNKSVAFARIPAIPRKTCMVDIRGKRYPVQIIKPPFITACGEENK